MHRRAVHDLSALSGFCTFHCPFRFASVNIAASAPSITKTLASPTCDLPFYIHSNHFRYPLHSCGITQVHLSVSPCLYPLSLQLHTIFSRQDEDLPIPSPGLWPCRRCSSLGPWLERNLHHCHGHHRHLHYVLSREYHFHPGHQGLWFQLMLDVFLANDPSRRTQPLRVKPSPSRTALAQSRPAILQRELQQALLFLHRSHLLDRPSFLPRFHTIVPAYQPPSQRQSRI